MKKLVIFNYIFNIVLLLSISNFEIGYAQESLKPESIFREFSYKNLVTPYKGDFDYFDSVQVDLNITDLKDAVGAEMALNFWGGHIGTSNQVFKINGRDKIGFPQPKTPGSPYCFFRCILGNPPVKIPLKMLKEGKNSFTFFCGEQICYGFNWPHYWINSFTVRVYYDKDRKECVQGIIKKANESSIAANLVEFNTEVNEPEQVESVEYIGYYKDYDLDGDGNLAGWQYTINNGIWDRIIDRKNVPPYTAHWNNYWVPQQEGTLRIIAKINSKNGISYLTSPIEFDGLKQINSIVKMYVTENIDENFSVRVGQRKQCNIIISDSLEKAVSAYLLVSTWSAVPEDGALHMIGINDKMLAESPGILHDWAFLKIPVPLEYLKTGINTFFIYSETEEHMLEVNYPGPSVLIRYSKGQ